MVALILYLSGVVVLATSLFVVQGRSFRNDLFGNIVVSLFSWPGLFMVLCFKFMVDE